MSAPVGFIIRSWPRESAHPHPLGDAYCENEWLPIIGPTAYLLARKLLLGGHEQAAARVAKSLGVGENKLLAAVNRLERFGLATVTDGGYGTVNVSILDRWPDAPVRRQEVAAS